MIKKNWKKILIILIVIIVSMSVGAYAAYLLNATEVSYDKNGTTVTVKAALDELYTKASNAPKVVFTQGQLVTYGGEQFYSLYDVTDKDTTMEIFAKTNIDRTNCNVQVNLPYGQTSCAFDNGRPQYWGNTTGLNLNNVTGYDAGDVMDKVNIYARAKGAISGRLLTIQEVQNLAGGTTNWQNSTTVDTKIKDMLNGVGNTQNTGSRYTSNGCFEYYWLGSGNESRAYIVWLVDGQSSRASNILFSSGDYYGVRPVLNVYKSEVTNAS